VQRWRRYGADRAFVVDAGGSPLGSVDLASGQIDLVEPEREDEVRHAVQAYLRSDSDDVVVPRPSAPPDGLTLADEDLLRQWLGAPIMLGGPGPGHGTSVRAQTDRLGDLGWTVAHDVRVGLQGSVCPHVVVGSPGVFTVRGAGLVVAQVELAGSVLLVDGAPSTLLRDAVFEARRVEALLAAAASVHVPVRPVVAVTGRLQVTRPGRGPLVLSADEVGDTLLALPTALRPGERLALSRAVSREQTWQR